MTDNSEFIKTMNQTSVTVPLSGEGIKFTKVKYIEFLGLISLIQGGEINNKFFEGEAKKLYEFIEDYHSRFSVYPTVDYVTSLTEHEKPTENLDDQFINSELKTFQLGVKIQKVTGEIGSRASEDPKKALDLLTQFLYETSYFNESEVEDIKFTDIDKRLQDYLTEDKIINTRCDFGLPVIDENTYGLCDGDVVLVVGGSNQGKSWLSKKIALTNTLKGKRIVLLPFEEMGEESIRRFDAIFGGVSSKSYIEKKLDAVQLAKLGEKAMQWKLTNHTGELIIPDIQNVRPGNMNDIVKLYKKYDADLVIIDQLNLFSPSYDWKDLASCVKALKSLAVSIKKPILVVAQAKMNIIKPIEEVGMEIVALGEEISRNADTVLYIGNDRDSDQLGTKFFKLIKTRRGSVGIITRNTWNINFSQIEEMGQFIPEVKPREHKKTQYQPKQQNNMVNAMNPSQYTTAWTAKAR